MTARGCLSRNPISGSNYHVSEKGWDHTVYSAKLDEAARSDDTRSLALVGRLVVEREGFCLATNRHDCTRVPGVRLREMTDVSTKAGPAQPPAGSRRTQMRLRSGVTMSETAVHPDGSPRKSGSVGETMRQLANSGCAALPATLGRDALARKSSSVSRNARFKLASQSRFLKKSFAAKR